MWKAIVPCCGSCCSSRQFFSYSFGECAIVAVGLKLYCALLAALATSGPCFLDAFFMLSAELFLCLCEYGLFQSNADVLRFPPISARYSNHCRGLCSSTCSGMFLSLQFMLILNVVGNFDVCVILQ